MSAKLTDPMLTTDAARTHLERLRWPHGPVCPHCGVVNMATLMEGKCIVPVSFSATPAVSRSASRSAR